MTNLQDKEYEDDHGKPVPAEKVTCLGSYTHHCDGFFQWTCGKCGVQHNNRWCHISGIVWYCGTPRTIYLVGTNADGLANTKIVYDDGCGALNLLVRTNCKEITESLVKKWEETERWKENEKLRGIVHFNEEKLNEIRREVVNAVSQALNSAIYLTEKKMKDNRETPKEFAQWVRNWQAGLTQAFHGNLRMALDAQNCLEHLTGDKKSILDRMNALFDKETVKVAYKLYYGKVPEAYADLWATVRPHGKDERFYEDGKGE
jgi:hypothetical protein